MGEERLSRAFPPSETKISALARGCWRLVRLNIKRAEESLPGAPRRSGAPILTRVILTTLE